jgi:uncharacterized membrane protein YbhN (UPF0104 family)
MSTPGSRLPPSIRIGALLFTGAGLTFAGLILWKQTGDLTLRWTELRSAGWQLRPGWLVLALGLWTANLFLIGRVWVVLVRGLGSKLDYTEGIRIWMVTNLGRYVPGKVWQLSGLAIYMRQLRQAGGIALVAALTFQVLTLATGAGVGLAVVGGWLARGELWISLAAVALSGMGLAVALHPDVIRRLGVWLTVRMGESSPPETVLSRGVLLRGSTILILSWVVYGLGLWCLWRGVGSVGGPDPVLWTGIFAAAYVIGYLALFAPGGIIVREGVLVALLVEVAAVSGPTAAGIAIMARLLAVASELAAVGVAWGLPGEKPAR